jgi:hypothetical protein
VNVRLDAERIRKAHILRERGLTLSDVVREAIDVRYAALSPADSPRNVRAIVEEVFKRHPDPPDQPRRNYSVHDRRAARAAMLRKLRRRKS